MRIGPDRRSELNKDAKKMTPKLDLATFSIAKWVTPKSKIRKTNIEVKMAITEMLKANFCPIVENQCIIGLIRAHSPNCR